jgi:hypothetical protein
VDDRADPKPIDKLTIEELFAEVELRLGAADDEALDELKDRVVGLQDQIERLTQVKLEGVTYEKGKLDIRVSFELCKVLAAHFWNILETAEAQNYVELHLVDQTHGRTAALEFNCPDMIEKIVILIQRSLGKTPHQLRREAEEHYEALRFGFATVAQLLIDAVQNEDEDAVIKAQAEAVKVALAHNITLTILHDPSTMAAEAENGDDRSNGGGGAVLLAGDDADTTALEPNAGDGDAGVRGEDERTGRDGGTGDGQGGGGPERDREPEMAVEEEAGQDRRAGEEGVPQGAEGIEEA